MKLSPAEQLAHSTVRIECDLKNGGVGTGTGFFYSLNRKGDQHTPVIITNKHVVAGASVGRFLLTHQNSDEEPAVGSYEKFELTSFEDRWTKHPDPDVDLCAMPIGPLLNEANTKGSHFFILPLDSALIPSESDIEEMMGLENITMVGYPNGLWDKTNNLPIFRRGVLATDYKADWNGKKEFVIDAACFPGSSGSPIMLFDVGSYQSRTGLNLGSSRIKLLGILYAGPQHTVEGEVHVVYVPTQQKAVAIAGIPNNLGIAIKSEQLNAFENLVS